MTRVEYSSLISRLNGWYTTVSVCRETLVGFIYGVETMMATQERKPLVAIQSLTTLLQNYIWNTYRIYQSTFDLAVDCVANKFEITWLEAFILVFDGMSISLDWSNETAVILRDEVGCEVANYEILNGETLKEFVTQDNQVIEVGHLIQLTDKIGGRDIQIVDSKTLVKCTNWDIFIPSRLSYSHVRFFADGATFGHVIAAYSLVESRIESIVSRDDKTYLRTEFFEIDAELAILNQEIKFNDEIICNVNSEWQIKNLTRFKDNAANFIIGVTTVGELWRGVLGLDIETKFPSGNHSKRLKYGMYGANIRRIILDMNGRSRSEIYK